MKTALRYALFPFEYFAVIALACVGAAVGVLVLLWQAVPRRKKRAV